MLWWTNADGQLPNVPRDAYWAWGLGDSLIVVIPSLDIVAVRAGNQADPDVNGLDPTPGVRVWNDYDWNGDYAVLAPFLDPIVQSVTP
jgi:CubicO group peptidase (beta-lactamase class C family)